MGTHRVVRAFVQLEESQASLRSVPPEGGGGLGGQLLSWSPTLVAEWLPLRPSKNGPFCFSMGGALRHPLRLPGGRQHGPSSWQLQSPAQPGHLPALLPPTVPLEVERCAPSQGGGFSLSGHLWKARPI